MKSYLITDPLYYRSTPEGLYADVQSSISRHAPDLLLYRDKGNPEYVLSAESFVEVCSKHETVKAMLHGDVALSYRLQAYGVHLTSQQLGEIKEAKALGLYVIASTHSMQEITLAIENGADAVTYSPIFSTPNKGEPKGLEDLKEIVGRIQINIFALGGITTHKQVKQVEATGAYGFASIRYFIEN